MTEEKLKVAWWKGIGIIAPIIFVLITAGISVIQWSRGTEKDLKAIKNNVGDLKDEFDSLREQVKDMLECREEMRILDARFDERLKTLEKGED